MATFCPIFPMFVHVCRCLYMLIIVCILISELDALPKALPHFHMFFFLDQDIRNVLAHFQRYCLHAWRHESYKMALTSAACAISIIRALVQILRHGPAHFA